MPAEPNDSDDDGGKSERHRDREHDRDREQERDLESQRRWQTRNDDDRPRGYRERFVEGGLNSFNKRPMETMLAVIIVGVGAQMYFVNKQTVVRETSMDARYDKIVAERKEEREHDAIQREKDRGEAEKRLQEVLANNKDTFQRVVEHLKYLSDSIAKISTQQQTLNLGYDRVPIVGDIAKKLLSKDSNAKLHTGTDRGTERPPDSAASGSDRDSSGASPAGVGVGSEPKHD